MRFLLALTLVAMFVSTWTPVAQANIKQLKVYRTVYPDYKPKCSYCHVDEKPKKDDGKHDLNAYGLKLQELMNGEPLTEEMVKSIGSHEEFEAEQGAPAADDMSANTEMAPATQKMVSTEEVLQDTKEMVMETRDMVEETQEMVKATQDMVTETAETTRELSAQMNTLITDAPQEIVKTDSDGVVAE